MKRYTERQKTMIVNNVVAATLDIEKLKPIGYNYLYLASGFIAHFNVEGFKDFYQNWSLATLKQNILEYKDRNQWNNFGPNDRDYSYYMDKKEIYNRICKALEK